jgi:glycosyltransferase involved in cell wall biosynthesis
MAERRLALQIVNNDHPPFGDLCQAYDQALKQIGLEVQTISLAPPRYQPVEGIEYLHLAGGTRNRQAAMALKARVRRIPAVAICHRYRAYRALRASGVAPEHTVAIAHDHGFFKRFQRRLERRLFARDVCFAGVSPTVQADLAAAVPDPLCLPNVLDLAALEEELLDRREALGALNVAEAEDSFTIGYVGRLIEWKRPGLALEALRRMEDRTGVRLLVVGDGPLQEELESAAESLPVTFCGFVPGARRLMKAFDVLLLTSTPREAFAMVVLEAMASGLPVVTGLAPGPQFVLGGTGYYYQRAEPAAVAEVLSQVRREKASGALADRLARAEARVHREFSVDALAARLEALITEESPSA